MFFLCNIYSNVNFPLSCEILYCTYKKNSYFVTKLYGQGKISRISCATILFGSFFNFGSPFVTLNIAFLTVIIASCRKVHGFPVKVEFSFMLYFILCLL